jgi:hypothetical protein
MLLFGFLIKDALWRRTSDKTLASTIQTLERRSEEAILLKSARDELQLCPTTLDAQMCAIRHLQGLVPGSSGAILAINNSRNMLEIAASWNDPAALSDGTALDTCCGLRTGRSRWRRPGLAMYPDHANNGNDLIRLADAALYEAKHAGRNQVQLAVGALTI